MIEFLKNNADWIFSGIGATILSFIVGGLFGGGVGYKIGISKTIKQTQRAGKQSTQSQIGEINVKK